MLNLERTRFIATGFFLMTATAVWSGQAEETLNAGLKLHEAGKPKEAIREYDHTIKTNPKLAEAYFNRSNAHYDLGQNEQAIEVGFGELGVGFDSTVVFANGFFRLAGLVRSEE